MKIYFAAAGALLLGSSALAWNPDDVDQTIHAATPTEAIWDKSLIAAKIEAAREAKLQTAALDTSLDTPLDKPQADFSGMGGPIEEKDAADMTLATVEPTGYPACSPGPGDDRCIQLYEPGVRTQLAAFKASEGPAGQAFATAMGGPDEAVEDDAAIGSAKVETAVDLSHHGHAGMGGPIEAQAGYPPCSPGPGDDRCIQLYEPGVTGVGN